MLVMRRDGVLQDLRHSFRALRRDRVFTVGAIVILALGIGANTAVFSLVNNILLRPLHYREPDRLFAVQEVIPQLSQFAPVLPVNAWHYREWKSRCSCFEDVALVAQEEINVTGAGQPERVSAAKVTANFFSVLGVPAQLGRTFVEDEGHEGKENVAILSDGLWRRRYGADPAVIGQTVKLNGISYVIIGILPSDFRHHLHNSFGRPGKEQVDIYKPWPLEKDESGWTGDHNHAAVARLPRGKTPEQALAELNVIQAEIARRFESSGQAVKWDLFGYLTPLQTQAVERAHAGLWLLLAAVGTVLLIACLNLGNLMLVRATARERDLAIRVALGASRDRIFTSILSETLLLALCGAVSGIAVAFALVRMFSTFAPLDLPRLNEVAIDWRALAFAVVLSIGAALLFGMVPALRTSRVNPQDSLRSTGRSLTDARGKLRIRELLVIAEVGLSVMLLVVAALLITSFVRLGAVARGFDAHNVLTAQISLPAASIPDREKRYEFYLEILNRLEAQPAVSAAGITAVLPLQGSAWADIVTIEGDTRPVAERPILSYRMISPHYLRALGIPLLGGRSLEESDHPRRVAVVSRSAADKLWPGQNPIGKRFRRAVPTEAAFEVIGIAGDVRSTGLDREPELIVYVPLWERSRETAWSIAIRTNSDPKAAVGLLRETVRSLNTDVPVDRIQTMTQIESDSVAQRRFQTLLVVCFAGSALSLALLGTYSVVAYSVRRRTSEIGIRIALGAKPAQIITMVLREGLRPVTIGLAAGVIGALALGRLVSALLFGVRPTDPATFIMVAGMTIGAALLACWIPSRRAASITALEALRQE